MLRTKTKKSYRYTFDEDALIFKYVEKYGTVEGIRRVANILGRTKSGVTQRYYTKMREQAKDYRKRMSVNGPATIEVNPPAPKTKTDSDVKSVKFTVKGVEIYMTFK